MSSLKENPKIGQKFSEGKLPLYTFIVEQFPNAIKEVCKASQAGNRKYKLDTDWQNFKRVENPIFQYRNAAMRHMLENGINQDMLEYGEVLHPAQAIWNLLAALEIELSLDKPKNTKLEHIEGLVKEISNDYLLGNTLRQLLKDGQ